MSTKRINLNKIFITYCIFYFTMDFNIRKYYMLSLLAASTLIIYEYKKRCKRRRRWWIRPINTRKVEQGDYYNLIQEMLNEDLDSFFIYTRMNNALFENLFQMVGPLLSKKSNRPCIPVKCRLLITLRLLSSGDSFQSVAFSYRIGKSTVCEIFRETCDVLWNILQPLYLPVPSENTWKEISNDFLIKWQLPNCVGAIDGKHVHIKQPNKSGSLYYNYKKTFSMILFAVCDANYKFVHVNIGSYGSTSDGGILKESTFGKQFQSGTINFPHETPLPNTLKPVPYFLAGDEAFPLQTNLLRPYSGRLLDDEKRIFNYRLSRARRCIENTFGILCSRWRIYFKTINAFPETVDQIVKATVCLHNYIITEEKKFVNEQPNKYFLDSDNYDNNENALGRILHRRIGTHNAQHDAIQFRNDYKNYVNSDLRSVPWQNNIVNGI